MTNLKTKITSAVSTAVLFGAAVTMAGLGFVVMATLAVFAFAVIAVALVSAPFVGLAEDDAQGPDATEMAA